jgi:hypothetical protein
MANRRATILVSRGLEIPKLIKKKEILLITVIIRKLE